MAARPGGGAGTERPPRRDRQAEHPALRERRRTVAREHGLRRRNRALVALCALAALALGYWVLTGPPLGVSGVRVQGYERPDRDRVVAALTVAGERGGMLSPPRAAMAEAVRPFPWVEDITVSRAWPRSLRVTVTPARPVALARGTDGSTVLVAASGRVLEPADDERELGTLRLPGESPGPGTELPQVYGELLGFLAALEPALAARVRDLAPTREGLVTARLDGGPELRLGRPERLRAKAVALGLVLPAIPATDRETAAYIDLSVPEHPAVGGMAETEPAEPPASDDPLVDTDGNGIPDTPASGMYGDGGPPPPAE
jgi:cell division septal protein FtsQ